MYINLPCLSPPVDPALQQVVTALSLFFPEYPKHMAAGLMIQLKGESFPFGLRWPLKNGHSAANNDVHLALTNSEPSQAELSRQHLLLRPLWIIIGIIFKEHLHLHRGEAVALFDTWIPLEEGSSCHCVTHPLNMKHLMLEHNVCNGQSITSTAVQEQKCFPNSWPSRPLPTWAQ